ncbi:hypothetical protein [Komagataeibacter saccharivorans]|uniref:hypothetical protein n=1 Tax=Komagataeibacter saccharivorans TaxID=265959 RepID=UPI0011AFC0F1|nr:hypothetical protein [Komagataeibacter saccharivorans]
MTDPVLTPLDSEGVSLDELSDRLGKEAAAEFFDRVDNTLRTGNVIQPTNVRQSRAVFDKARRHRRALLIISGRGANEVGDSMVIIKMDDFEAVVRAGREAFSWANAFAPRSGLGAATNSMQIARGSRGRRQLRA